MAVLTKQSLKEDGLNPTYAAAAAAGDSFNNTGEEFLHVKNGHTAALTVTVDSINNSITEKYYGKLTKPDAVVSIPAGESRFIGPFPVGGFGGSPAITYSAVTAMSVALIGR